MYAPADDGAPLFRTVYGIPESNAGFQMLARLGWDREEGLGPEGRKGGKFPVKTVLKKDRKGLGFEKTTARVTHVMPQQKNVGKTKKNAHERLERPATLSRRARNQNVEREKRTERALRWQLLGI
jgi:hypothetical protein